MGRKFLFELNFSQLKFVTNAGTAVVNVVHWFSSVPIIQANQRLPLMN